MLNNRLKLFGLTFRTLFLLYSTIKTLSKEIVPLASVFCTSYSNT